MPKKSPQTATGGKGKATPGDKTDPQHKEGEQADLEVHGKEESNEKRNQLTIYGRTSTQGVSQASTSSQVPEKGTLGKLLLLNLKLSLYSVDFKFEVHSLFRNYYKTLLLKTVCKKVFKKLRKAKPICSHLFDNRREMALLSFVHTDQQCYDWV